MIKQVADYTHEAEVSTLNLEISAIEQKIAALNQQISPSQKTQFETRYNINGFQQVNFEEVLEGLRAKKEDLDQKKHSLLQLAFSPRARKEHREQSSISSET